MSPAPESRPKLVYVIPHLTSDSAEHFAHIPALLAVLGNRVDIVAVVERGDAPARLDGVRLVLRVPGRGRIGRFVGSLWTVRCCASAGYRTYFLRYSRLFLVALIVSRPLFGHRVLFWQSGMSDVLDPDRRRALGHRLKTVTNRLQLRFVDRLVTGPESMVIYLARRWSVPRDRICLLYNDVDVDRFTPLEAGRDSVRARLGWAADEFVVLFVHRLSYRKGAGLLVPLLRALLARTAQPVRLVVAGDGPDRRALEQAAAGLACGGRLELLGAVPNRRLPELYAAADCFLMPSYEEGFPRVLLEAMASALPIVGTDAGGSADVVGADYPYLTRTGDLDGLVRHLLAVIRLTAAERRELGDRLRARACTRFSTQQVAGMLEELL